jgi:hypothetical protein
MLHQLEVNLQKVVDINPATISVVASTLIRTMSDWDHLKPAQ